MSSMYSLYKNQQQISVFFLSTKSVKILQTYTNNSMIHALKMIWSNGNTNIF